MAATAALRNHQPGSMRVSVIVPVLNEENTIGQTLAALQATPADEVLVVDGGSTDRTRAVAEQAGATVLSAARGRARQMNCGAGRTSGEALLFLHADTRLPATAMEDIRAALSQPQCVGGRFDVELDSSRWVLRVVGRMISLRSRLTKVATGEQAMFVRREVFQELGGFPEIPLMEDIAFSRVLKRKGRVACLKSRVVTSARRWETEGVWRTIFKMWGLKMLYLAGISPLRLKRYYGDAR